MLNKLHCCDSVWGTTWLLENICCHKTQPKWHLRAETLVIIRRNSSLFDRSSATCEISQHSIENNKLWTWDGWTGKIPCHKNAIYWTIETIETIALFVHLTPSYDLADASYLHLSLARAPELSRFHWIVCTRCSSLFSVSLIEHIPTKIKIDFTWIKPNSTQAMNEAQRWINAFACKVNKIKLI